MRVLFVGTDFAPVPPTHYGGIERVVAEISASMARRGHACALLATPGSGVEGVDTHVWQPASRLSSAVSFGMQTLSLGRAFEADLVHSFGQTKWIMPWAMSGGRALLSFGVLPQRRIRLVRPLLAGRLLFAGCSDYITRAGRDLIGGRWRTVYNCLDVTRYRWTDTVADDAPLVFLSRIDPIKGPHLAIDLARRAGRRLVIAGNHVEDGVAGEYWRDMVKPRIDGTAVEYVGPVNDTQKNALLMQSAGLLVPIQWDEPFGLVFIEALASGTPVISFARGSLPEIVREGVDGFLGRSDDELLRGIARLRDIDRRVCRQRVEDCFSTERIADRYEALYSEAINPAVRV
jgi:glycosyltransferase involved in cell wall biosynthesis